MPADLTDTSGLEGVTRDKSDTDTKVQTLRKQPTMENDKDVKNLNGSVPSRRRVSHHETCHRQQPRPDGFAGDS